MSELSFPTLPPAPPPLPITPGARTEFLGGSVTSTLSASGGSLLYAVSANTLNRAARSTTESQQTVGGANTLLPLVYGTAPVGGRIAAAKVDAAGALVVLVAWCLGEVDSVVETRINDGEVPGGVTVTSYTGTSGQAADATMAATFSGYSDALPGICYSVFKLTRLATTGFPRFTAKIKGMKVRATSGGARAWSDNPAYALADLIESTTYGLGRTVDWATVATLASACDTLVGGERKRIINLALDQSLPGADWLQTLRDYAGAFVIPEGSSYRLVPDATGSSVKSFTAANIVAGSVRLTKRGTLSSPTMVEVAYTDTSAVPWREAVYTTPASTPRRLSRISKPGITRYSEAKRYATERLNESLLNDLSITFTAFDEGLELQAGELIDVTHPLGLTAKVFRVASIAPNGPGRWAIHGTEYDAAKYDSTVATGPTTVDTNLPLPSEPPELSGLSATEETYALDSGIFASRVRVTWADPASFPFVGSYRVALRIGSTEVHSALVDGNATSYATPALQEGQTYTVEAAIISTTGATGEAATTLVAIAGKSIVPGDVLTFTGFEVGGRVFLSWDRADNPTSPGTPDPDVWRYEVRRGTTAQAWGDAGVTVLDQTDGLRLVDEGAPAGTWRYRVKAIDSVGQYSSNDKSLDVTVTTDSASFLVDSYEQTSPTLTNMVGYTLAPTDAHTYYVTDDGVVFGTKFSSNLGTYTNALATYHNSVTSTWQGEAEDFGSLLGGQWTGTADVTDISGSHTSYLGYHASSTTLTYVSGLSQKVNARFAGLKHEALTTSTMMVRAPSQTIRLDAIPRSETGSGTSSASTYARITLANDYVAVKRLTVTPFGTTARSAVADNIVTGDPTTFDVYVFNDSGTKIVSDFRYEWQGV